MYKTEVIKPYLSLSHKIFLTLHPLLGFRSSVGLEQQPSKLWVLGSNPSRITKQASILIFWGCFFCICAPTKTQWVLGSNPAESQLSVLIREQGVETWLEASTERSESNPGRSLGIYTAYSDSCQEDSTSQRPSIRCQSDKSVFEKNSVVNEHGLNGLNGWNKIIVVR